MHMVWRSLSLSTWTVYVLFFFFFLSKLYLILFFFFFLVYYVLYTKQVRTSAHASFFQ